MRELPRQGGDADDEIAATEAAGHGEVALAIGRLAEIAKELAGDRIRLEHGGDGEAVTITDPDNLNVLVVAAPVHWNFQTEGAA